MDSRQGKDGADTVEHKRIRKGLGEPANCLPARSVHGYDHLKGHLSEGFNGFSKDRLEDRT